MDKGLSIYIAPIRKGGKIKSDSTMAAISEESREVIGKIKSIEAVGIKEISIK